ncbi:MAG: DUF58 domain-containing protein [Nanoarchaeota archaeon]
MKSKIEDKIVLNIDVANAISVLHSQMKQFEIKTKKFKSFFRGKSFDFDGYRTYTPDDDVSYIDWMASYRSDKLLVKQFKEEEKLKILFLVDVGENMILGSKNRLKCESAAEIVLAISYLLSSAGHKVGHILFSDNVKGFAIPSTGLNNFYVFSDLLLDSNTYGGASRMDVAIEFLLNNFDASISAVILVSDFLNFNKKIKRSLDLLANKYESFAFMVKDPLDKTMPNIAGEFILEDTNTGRQILVDPKIARKSYENYALKQEKFVRESFKDDSMDLLELSTIEEWPSKVADFLKRRAEREVVI